jgi:hypothetical protein
MRWSTLLSLPLQLVFPVMAMLSFFMLIVVILIVVVLGVVMLSGVLLSVVLSLIMLHFPCLGPTQ